jgi:hypothetical protein
VPIRINNPSALYSSNNTNFFVSASELISVTRRTLTSVWTPAALSVFVRGTEPPTSSPAFCARRRRGAAPQKYKTLHSFRAATSAAWMFCGASRRRPPPAPVQWLAVQPSSTCCRYILVVSFSRVGSRRQHVCVRLSLTSGWRLCTWPLNSAVEGRLFLLMLLLYFLCRDRNFKI